MIGGDKYNKHNVVILNPHPRIVTGRRLSSPASILMNGYCSEPGLSDRGQTDIMMSTCLIGGSRVETTEIVRSRVLVVISVQSECRDTKSSNRLVSSLRTPLAIIVILIARLITAPNDDGATVAAGAGGASIAHSPDASAGRYRSQYEIPPSILRETLNGCVASSDGLTLRFPIRNAWILTPVGRSHSRVGVESSAWANRSSSSIRPFRRPYRARPGLIDRYTVLVRPVTSVRR